MVGLFELICGLIFAFVFLEVGSHIGNTLTSDNKIISNNPPIVAFHCIVPILHK